MQETYSVLIPDGQVMVALPVAHCLVDSRKVKLHILSNKRWNRCRFLYRRASYTFRPTSGSDEEYLEAIIDLITRFKIDVLLPVTPTGMKFVAGRRQAFSELVALPPLPSVDLLETARDKWLLTEIARKHHLPVPQSTLVTFDSAFYQQLSNLEYPVLLKPTLGEGGRGICRFENFADLQEFLDRQVADRFENRYLVQSYVPGTDLGLSVLCRNGEILAYTIQQGLMSQRFGPLKAMQFVEQEDLLGSLVAGVNFPYLTCLEALGEPFSIPRYHLVKYLHTGTAVKEMFLRVFRRGNLDGFGFSQTGLRFFLADPMPEIVDLTAKGMQYWYKRRGIPPKETSPFGKFLADWYPLEFNSHRRD
jgi:D-aspartate ligase